jgi:hypothetical protein
MYEIIRLYEDTKVDYLMWKNSTATESEIEEVFESDYLASWETFEDLEIMADFTTSLSSSYLSGLTSPLIGYVVFREKKGETKQTKIATVTEDVNKIIDYMVANKEEYRWRVYPLTETQLGISLISDYLKTCWDYWAVLELVKGEEDVFAIGEIWKFNANFATKEVTQNLDQTVFKTYSQFPKISTGDENYKTLGFSCLLKEMTTTESVYSDTKELKNAWDRLLAKNNPVLFKDLRGNIFYGLITNPNSKNDDRVNGQPTTIDVSFVELALPDNFSVFKEV